jgi:signal transduction histidine kinase
MLLMANQDANYSGSANHDKQKSDEKLAQMSHDFRSPLNIIIGFTELLLDEVPGKINDEQRRSLKDIKAASERLLDLMNKYFEMP